MKIKPKFVNRFYPAILVGLAIPAVVAGILSVVQNVEARGLAPNVEKTIGTNFDADYSQGIVFRSVKQGTTPVPTISFSKGNVNNYPCKNSTTDVTLDGYFCYDNTAKDDNVYVNIENGAYLDGELLDVREYVWIQSSPSGSSIQWGMPKSTTVKDWVGIDMFSKNNSHIDGTILVARELHFYKHVEGSSVGTEVNFNGVLGQSGINGREGIRIAGRNFVQAYVYTAKFPDFTTTCPTATKVATLGMPTYSGSNPQWVSIIGDEGITPGDLATQCGLTDRYENNIYAEVKSTTSQPLLIYFLSTNGTSAIADHQGTGVISGGNGVHNDVESYTVKYNISGAPSGVSAPTTDILAIYGTKTASSATSVTGYTFDGWYTDSAMTTKLANNTIKMANKNINLYGKYVKSPALTYNVNGGTGTMAKQTCTVTSGESCSVTVASEKNKIARAGYEFLGWADSATATTPNPNYASGNNISLTGDKTIYAVWKANPAVHVLIYDPNGGTNTLSNQTCVVTEGTSCSVGIISEENRPTRDGYAFLGWANSATATAPDYTAGNSIELANAEKTIYAVWAPTLTYDPNGGINGPKEQTCNTGTECKISKIEPTREGYTFIGWADTKDATKKQYGPNDKITLTESKTIYAVWEKTGPVDPSDVKVPDTGASTSEMNAAQIATVSVVGVLAIGLVIRLLPRLFRNKVKFD